MTKTLTALAIFAALTVPALAQDSKPAPQETVGVATLDPATIATGWRASKIIGSTVENENGDNIGSVDDLILTADQQVPYAVLSVGGFLGIGAKLVAVPYLDLDTTQKGNTILRAATKESLTAAPEFKYAE
jgi:sporulation protein YlmC with PRC-barrel domain